MTAEQSRRAGLTVELGAAGREVPAPGEHRVMTIMARNTTTQGADSQPARDLPAPEYADVEAALGLLRAAVDAAVAADETQAQSVMARLSRSFPGLLPMVLPQVQEAAASMAQTVSRILGDIERIAQEWLAPHAEVPGRLETERDSTRSQGEALVAMAGKVIALTRTDGWEGEASQGYTRAAIVQASALEELGGVELSSANALDRAALLNRAAFCYATEAIRFTTKQVSAAPSGNSAQLFLRTRQIEGELHALAAQLQSELDAIGGGRIVEKLAADLTTLLETPVILQPNRWPTGGAAAETRPARTATVIPAN